MKRLLSISEAAQYCGICVTLFNREVAIAVSAVRIGERKLYDIRALDAHLDTIGGFPTQSAPEVDHYGEWRKGRAGVS